MAPDALAAHFPGADGPPLRLVVASLTPVSPSEDGRWRAFNRVAEVAEDLNARGWETTLLGRAGQSGHTHHHVADTVTVHAVNLRRVASREWWRAAATGRAGGALLIFMPSLSCAILALVVGRRAVVYAGGTWGLRDDFPAWRARLEQLVARRAAAMVVSGHAVETYFRGSARRIELTVPLVPVEVRERFRRPVAERSREEPLRVLFVGWI